MIRITRMRKSSILLPLGLTLLLLLMQSCVTFSYTAKIPSKSKTGCQDSNQCYEVSDIKRNEVLDSMWHLVETATGREKVDYEVDSVIKNAMQDFFIYDLVELRNNRRDTPKIKIKNLHIYHFGHNFQYFSYSNILIVNGGKVEIFKYLNCEKTGSYASDILDYIHKNNLSKYYDNKVLRRIKNYRKYGDYFYDRGTTKNVKRNLPNCKCLRDVLSTK